MPTWQTTKGIFSVAADTKFARVVADVLDEELRALTVTVALDGVNVGRPTPDSLVLDYRAEPSASEKQLVEAAVAAHEGVPRTDPQARVTEQGALAVEVKPRSGSPFEDYSINWCDPTTWWPDAVEVAGVTATPTANPRVFDLPDVNLIDVRHGKITQEARLDAMAPVVTVAGVALTERAFGHDEHDPAWGPNPHDAGDYRIDYAAGTIELFSTPPEAPVVTYHKATTSNWYITPKEGKGLHILAVEVQFSTDVEMRDDMIFAPEILAAAAAAGGMLDPALLASNGGPIPDTSYLPIQGNDRVYRRIRDFVVESQRAYPVIPQIGGSGPRALETDFIVWRWPYEEAAARDLSAQVGTRIRIGLAHHIPFGGSFVNASTYSISETL